MIGHSPESPVADPSARLDNEDCVAGSLGVTALGESSGEDDFQVSTVGYPEEPSN